jgi:3',5'-cyclic AMP phosphodiesterase CpdA
MTLGNHDDRVNLLAAFTEHPGEPQDVGNKHVTVVEDGPVRFILLDSLFQVNLTPGFLGRAQRRWLDGYLAAASEMPTIVFVHHTLDDSDSALLDADRMLRMLSGHSMVKAVFYGHSHVHNYDTLDGMHLVNQPAVSYSFAEDQPLGWLETTFRADGADLKLHAIGGNTEADGVTRSLRWR